MMRPDSSLPPGPDLTNVIDESGKVIDPVAFGVLFRLTPADAEKPADFAGFTGNMGQVLRNRRCPVSDAWREAVDEGGLDAGEQVVKDLARALDKRSTYEFKASPQARNLEAEILRRQAGEKRRGFHLFGR